MDGHYIQRHAPPRALVEMHSQIEGKRRSRAEAYTVLQCMLPRVFAAFLLFKNAFQLSNTDCIRMVLIFLLIVSTIIAG